MTGKSDVKCEYLEDGKFCKSICESDEGKAVREESCANNSKETCCYVCADRKTCEISCNYLEKPAVTGDKTRNSTNIGHEFEAEYPGGFKGEYLGGHPAFPKKSNVHLLLESQNLSIPELDLSISYRSIKRIENMTKEKISATRVVFLGIAGALWKKEQQYMVLTFRDKAAGNDLSLIFKMNQIEEAQPSIYQKIVAAKAKK